jgi:RimJ/RimL family protein N-acetyltransferase
MGPSAILCLVTEHLCLRPVRAEDAARTAELVTPDVSDNLLSWPWPMSPQQAKEKVRDAEARLQQRTAVNFAMVRRDEQDLIGWIGLAVQPGGAARLGYWIATPFRDRGLATEAARAAIPAAAEFLGVDQITAEVFSRNLASISVLNALGFHNVGSTDIRVPGTGRTEPSLRFSLSVSKVATQVERSPG